MNAVASIARRTLPRRADYPRNRSQWTGDLVAGITVAVVALPLALGFGVAAGVGPGPGIITAIVAGIVAAIFGGSDVQVSGPTGAMTVVLLPAIAAFGPGIVGVLAVLAGLIVLGAGWLRLGRAVTLIPWPVIEGFTVGIAVIIFLQQLPLVLGTPRADETETLRSAASVIAATDWTAAAAPAGIALCTIVVMAGLRTLRPALPASLIAIIVATLVSLIADADVATVGTITLQSLNWGISVPAEIDARDLLSAALVIAFLAALESLLSARVADGMRSGDSADPDRELVGQGLANIASGLAGGIPATGAIARTAVNVRAGAQTRVASIVHGGTLAAMLAVGATLVARVPLAALGGVLMLTALRMVDREAIRALFRAGRADAFVFSVAAGFTIVFDLVLAVEVGIVVAAILALRRAAKQSTVHEEPIDDYLHLISDADVRALLAEHIVVYRLHGSLFFGAAHHFLEELVALDDARVVILRMGSLQMLDATGAHALRESIQQLHDHGVHVLVCGLQERHKQLFDAVCLEQAPITADDVFTDLSLALERARSLAQQHE